MLGRSMCTGFYRSCIASYCGAFTRQNYDNPILLLTLQTIRAIVMSNLRNGDFND